MLHIGIVACSTEGAALCYRTISFEGSNVLGRHHHPQVSLHSHSLAAYMKYIYANDWAGVAELMLSSADKRLSEVYSRQSDGELEQVAQQMSDLTETAREALRAELARRDLYVGELEEPADSVAPDFRPLVTVRSFWNLLEAELAKGLLDAAGIESFLFDDNMVRMDWFNAAALGGIKLRVDPEQVEAAKRALEQANAEAIPEDQEPTE